MNGPVSAAYIVTSYNHLICWHSVTFVSGFGLPWWLLAIWTPPPGAVSVLPFLLSVVISYFSADNCWCRNLRGRTCIRIYAVLVKGDSKVWFFGCPVDRGVSVTQPPMDQLIWNFACEDLLGGTFDFYSGQGHMTSTEAKPVLAFKWDWHL